MVGLTYSPRVWLITGIVSRPSSHSMSRSLAIYPTPGTPSGFGLRLVETAVARGDRVIATARSLAAIRHLEQPTCRILELDVTSAPEVLQRKAKEALSFWGRIDVLVNNAGFGGLGIAEEAG